MSLPQTALTSPLLQAQGLSKSLLSPNGTLRILDDVNLELDSAQALAIVGPSGSGKSTLLGLLAGLDDVTSGEVILLGQSLKGLDEDKRARLRAGQVGFVFQSFHLLPGFSARENISLAAELAGLDDVQTQTTLMLEQLGLAERMDHYPEQLSGGEQQRVALGRAFICRPKILFADEPTGNLDPETSISIIELMFKLRADYGASLVLVTHDYALAQRCERQITLYQGRIASSKAHS